MKGGENTIQMLRKKTRRVKKGRKIKIGLKNRDQQIEGIINLVNINPSVLSKHFGYPWLSTPVKRQSQWHRCGSKNKPQLDVSV